MIGVSPGRQSLAVKVCSWPIRGCRHRIHLSRPRTELAMKIYHGLWMENLRWADLFQSSTDRRAAEIPKIGRATSAAYCGLTNEVSDQLDHPSSLVWWGGVKQCRLEWVTSPLIKLLNYRTGEPRQRCFMLLLVAGCITSLESSVYVTVPISTKNVYGARTHRINTWTKQ